MELHGHTALVRLLASFLAMFVCGGADVLGEHRLKTAIFCATASLICGRGSGLFAQSASPSSAFLHTTFLETSWKQTVTRTLSTSKLAPLRETPFRRSSPCISELRCLDIGNELPPARRFHTSNQVPQTFARRSKPAARPRGEVQVGTLMVDGYRTFYKTVLPTTLDPEAHQLVLVHGFGISSDHFA